MNNLAKMKLFLVALLAFLTPWRVASQPQEIQLSYLNVGLDTLKNKSIFHDTSFFTNPNHSIIIFKIDKEDSDFEKIAKVLSGIKKYDVCVGGAVFNKVILKVVVLDKSGDTKTYWYNLKLQVLHNNLTYEDRHIKEVFWKMRHHVPNQIDFDDKFCYYYFHLMESFASSTFLIDEKNVKEFIKMQRKYQVFEWLDLE